MRLIFSCLLLCVLLGLGAASADTLINFDVDTVGTALFNGQEITNTYASWGATFGATGPAVLSGYEDRALVGTSSRAATSPMVIGFFAPPLEEGGSPSPIRTWYSGAAVAHAYFATAPLYVSITACAGAAAGDAYLTAYFSDSTSQTISQTILADAKTPLSIVAPGGKYITQVDFSGSTENSPMRFDNLQYDPEYVIPEPGTMALLGLGLAGLGARLRRRKR